MAMSWRSARAVPGGGADGGVAGEIGEPAGAGFLEEMPGGGLRFGFLERGEHFFRERFDEGLDPEALLEGGVGVTHGFGQNAEEGVGERGAVVLGHPLRELDEGGGGGRRGS